MSKIALNTLFILETICFGSFRYVSARNGLQNPFKLTYNGGILKKEYLKIPDLDCCNVNCYYNKTWGLI